MGTPREVFQGPADTFVANFIGSTPMNLLDGTVRGDQVECVGARLPLPLGLVERQWQPLLFYGEDGLLLGTV